MKMKTDLNTSEENNEKLQNSYDSKQKEQIILQDQFNSMKINLMGESDQKKVALEERDLAKKQNEKTLSELKTLEQKIEPILNEKFVFFIFRIIRLK